MFYAGIGEVTENQLISAQVHGEFRRRLLRRFPYAIYYRIEGNEIIVFGLFHCARDPRAITSTLGSRDAS